MKKWISGTFLSLVLFACTYAETGYRIQVKVDGLQDTVSYLAYHFGDRQFLKDTVRVDAFGNFVFEGEERLEPGIYLVVLPGQRYFEIIVDKNQHFSVYTTAANPGEDIRFENSPDNTAFYEHIKKLQNANEAEARKLQDEYIKKFPNGLFSMILLAQRGPEMPETPLGREDDQAQAAANYFRFRNAFWNNVDFSDDRILRSPVYHGMLSRYFNQVLVQIPDTIISEADRLLNKSMAHPEMFRYTLWFLANNAERSNIMGMDAVFVHLADQYYMKGKAHWMTQEGLDRISERAEKLRPLLIGSIAPDIRVFLPDGSTVSLHDTDARYLILYFWDSECSFCKEETPALKSVYEQFRDQQVKVFAMNTEANRNSWLSAINRYGLGWINVNDAENRSGYREKYDIYSIPVIYLLNSKKEIIAKHIGARQVGDFLRHELSGN